MRTLRAKPPPPASAEWAYFLDVDGSLIELAATPDAVRADADLLRLLADLQARTEGALALVSGRTPVSYTHLDVYKRQSLLKINYFIISH